MELNNKVVNTAGKEQHPEWMSGGNPDAIVEQEARGQKQLVESSVLPASLGYGLSGDQWNWKILTDAGLEFGEPVKGDTIFRHVKFPEGWKLAATDHTLWSNLLDGEGMVRARIFYKAAFYDRNATLYILEKPEKPDA